MCKNIRTKSVSISVLSDALGVALAILCDVLRSNIGAAASHRNGVGGGVGGR